MAERFTRVFSQSGQFYCPGAPVIIQAGALLKDNQTGNIIAQVKFKNISPKTIKALFVKIYAKDVSGADIEGVDNFQYLDLNVRRDKEFGSKTPIALPNAVARSFSCECLSAIFSNGTTWVCDDDAQWSELPAPTALEKVISNALIEQFERDTGLYSNCTVTDHQDLWYCTCGAINHSGEDVCHYCQAKKADLLAALNTDTLTANKEKYDAEVAANKKKRDAEIAAQRAAEEEAARIKSKKNKKIAAITIPTLCAIIAFVILLTTFIIPNGKYKDAIVLMDEGKYSEAIYAFEALGGYKDSATKIAECKYREAVKLLEAGKHTEAMFAFGGIGDYPDAKEQAARLWNQVAVWETLATGAGHTVGVKADGTVVAVGNNDFYQCDVSDWTDIVAISAGTDHTVGLKADGTVVAVGNNHDGCDVSDWTGIVAITAGIYHTVGLKADGTVVAVGNNDFYQRDVSSWTDIVAISTGHEHTVGLKADGTVVAVGNNDFYQCDVSDWTDIVAISAGNYHTAGLKADGTVVAVGYNGDGRCNLNSWTDIVAISAGFNRTVGLKADGTVVAEGSNEEGQCNIRDWTDIVAISAGGSHTAGLKADGTVVAVGYNDNGRCDVSDWTNIKIPKNNTKNG